MEDTWQGKCGTGVSHSHSQKTESFQVEGAGRTRLSRVGLVVDFKEIYLYLRSNKVSKGFKRYRLGMPL